MFRAFSEHKLMIAALFVVGLGLSCALPAGAEPILVAEKWANTIHLYTLKADKTVTYEGIWADASADLAPGIDPLYRPNRMALLNGKVYVAEEAVTGFAPRILRFDTSGNFEAVMPAPSTTPWTSASGSILAHNGAIYVADAMGAVATNNIYKISNPGTDTPSAELFVGTGPYNDQHLNTPRGIAFRSPDPNADFYVADRANNRFLQFDASGTYEGVFNSGNTPATPQFIAWKDDVLYSSEGGGIRMWNSNGTRGDWHVTSTNNPASFANDIAWSLAGDLYYIGFTGTGAGQTGLYRRNANGTVTMLAGNSSIVSGSLDFTVASGLLIIPEPSSMLLLAVLGLFGLARRRRRK